MAIPDRDFGQIENNAGLMVGYVDRNGVERDLAGNVIAAGSRPSPGAFRQSGLVFQSAVPASVTGTLSETTLATIAIPAGAVGLNGVLRVTTLWTFTSSADSKTIQARLGGTSIGLAAMTANSGLQHQIILRNRAAPNSQIAFTNGQTSFAVTSGAMVTTAIDTSVAQNLTFTGTIGANAGSNTITLEGYTVEILNP